MTIVAHLEQFTPELVRAYARDLDSREFLAIAEARTMEVALETLCTEVLQIDGIAVGRDSAWLAEAEVINGCPFIRPGDLHLSELADLLFSR